VVSRLALIVDLFDSIAVPLNGSGNVCVEWRLFGKGAEQAEIVGFESIASFLSGIGRDERGFEFTPPLFVMLIAGAPQPLPIGLKRRSASGPTSTKNLSGCWIDRTSIL